MKTELITKLEEILATSDISAVANLAKNLQRDYEKQLTIDIETAKQEFVDEGGKARDFNFTKSAEDEKIIQLFERIRKRKKEDEEKLAVEQSKNLEIKQLIIKDISDLTKMDASIGSAFKKLQELQAKWKETGAVSPHKYKEVQADYSKAVEDFFYNVNIFKALQDHDLKRNYDLKVEVIAKFKALADNNNIKDVEQLIKTYRNDWEEIGPVPQDKWETMKVEYRDAVDALYAKLKAHYNALEEVRETNLASKKALLEKAKGIVEHTPENEKEWKAKTEELIALQTEYKMIGRTEQKAGDEVWKEFRHVCDSFFDKKKDFYAVLKTKYDEIKKKKLALIQQAEDLRESTDWKNTSEKLIKIQNSWKALPSAGGDEQKLFLRFRKACNTFFEAKQNHYSAQDASFETNLKAKEEILARITAYSLTGDEQNDKTALRTFNEEWTAAGMVPFKEKQRVNDAFYNKLDELYNGLNLNKQEKFVLMFKSKVDKLSNSESPENALRKESEYLKKQIDEINNNIRTYENNLGFFKSSKGKNDFITEIENKVNVEKAKIADFKTKQKMVNEAIAELRKATEQPKAEA